MNRDKPRLPLPALLLFLGCVLSCSTACITSAIIDKATDQARAIDLADAEALLEKNRLALSGQTALPVITTDPATIERALRSALPLHTMFSLTPYFSKIEVVIVKHQPDSRITFYEISAYGDFTPAYASAFVRYVRKLWSQLPDHYHCSILTYTGTPDARIQVYGF